MRLVKSIRPKHYLVFVLFLIAFSCRYLTVYVYHRDVLSLDLIRTSIYIALTIWWAFSIRVRVVRNSNRRVFITIAALIVFWVVVRSCRYYFVEDPTIKKWLWFSYYISMVLIPTCCLTLAVHASDTNNKPLNKKLIVAFSISVVLILIVLTNDLHELVFVFDRDFPIEDEVYSPGLIYFIIMAWELLQSLVALLILITKYKRSNLDKAIILPFVPFVAMCVYVVTYGLGYIPCEFLDDMTLVNCLLIILTFEACIHSGLIRVNSHYISFFKNSELEVAITDEDLKLLLASNNFNDSMSFDGRQLLANGYVDTDGTRTRIAALDSGYVVWRQDITRLSEILSELEQTRQEIANRNSLLAQRVELDKKRYQISQQDELFTLVSLATKDQIALLSDLIGLYKLAESNTDKRSLLSKIAVVGAYLKRRNNLVFSSYSRQYIDLSEVGLCINESLTTLKMAGISASYKINLFEEIHITLAYKMYDFIEAVIEASFSSAQAYLVILDKLETKYLVKVLVDEVDDLSKLKYQYQKDINITKDLDGEYLISMLFDSRLFHE